MNAAFASSRVRGFARGFAGSLASGVLPRLLTSDTAPRTAGKPNFVAQFRWALTYLTHHGAKTGD